MILNTNFIDKNNILSTQNKQLGSSETTRVISYFSDSLNFGYYLAGLMDADGTIFISNKNSISIEITLHEKDVKTLYKLKSLLGFGIVSKRSNVKAYRIRINKTLAIEKFIHLINGKLLTKQKHRQLIKVCEILHLTPIINNSFSKDNAWFAGFFDGEGYFSIRNQYTLTLSLSQKDKNILQLICSNFDCGNIYYDKSWNGYSYCITDLNNLKKVLKYFSFFPLLTVKNCDLRTFHRLVLFKERKYHLKESQYKYKIDTLIKVFKNRKKI